MAEVLPIQLAIGGISVAFHDGVWYTHPSFGQIIVPLARRVQSLQYFGPESPFRDGSSLDYPLTGGNITVQTWSPRRNSLQAMRHPLRLLREYSALARGGDAIFLRGSHPLCWLTHWFAWWRRRPIVHWLVGNPVAARRAERRGYSTIKHHMGIVFALSERWMLKLGIAVSRSEVIANGEEVARLFRTPRTRAVVSTSISESDFFERPDTCQGDRVRLLFVGFIRPEKGIEYLLRAMAKLQSNRPVDLAIVGPWDQFSGEKTRLESLIDTLGLGGRVSWEGHAAFGNELFGHMDRSDILVLPTLSEGTPRVLVEGRARSLPIVSTTVGGIPTSVTDGKDGLLVPPKNAGALADAITRIIDDGELRRRLIVQGRERVASLTIERFVDGIIDALKRSAQRKDCPWIEGSASS